MLRLERLIDALPRARLLMRLDGGFACPEIFEFLEEAGINYVIAMAGNAVRERHAEKWMKTARRMSRRSGQTEDVYGQCLDAAKGWNRRRGRQACAGEAAEPRPRSLRHPPADT